jgi:hypothetical protein
MGSLISILILGRYCPEYDLGLDTTGRTRASRQSWQSRVKVEKLADFR